MAAIILDGSALSRDLQPYLREQVGLLAEQHRCVPSLVAMLVGGDAASVQYVRNKRRLAKAIGLGSTTIEIAAGEATTRRMLVELARLNQDEQVTGILIQLPLPAEVDTSRLFDAIDLAKDVDGVGPATVVSIYRAAEPAFVPCTPRGVIALMRRYQVPIAGRRAVVIGRSDITGKPLAMMLGGRQYNATVTWCHRHTRDLGAICREADILVPCVGADPVDGKFLITADMVKPGACVIDVGFRRLADGTFAGDVDFNEVEKVAGWITPNPGGVGPMTVLALMQNVIDAARYRLGLPRAEYPV